MHVEGLFWKFGVFALATRQVLGGIIVDIEDADSVETAANLVAQDLMSFYNGDQIGEVPGILPGPPPDGKYYWWNAGSMWGSMLSYRNKTGNTTYDDVVTQALQFQTGPDADYMPLNWTASMGNDDQLTWAMSAMLAAEIKYTNPASDEPHWLTLAKNVFDEQTNKDRRLANGSCKGLLRWQIWPTNNGYNYVNGATNAGYFNLGARLAKLTGNKTYAEHAATTYDLLSAVELISEDYDVYDGLHAPDCDDMNRQQFSYSAAWLLEGTAFMYNFTNDPIWKTRIDGLTDRTLEVFFPEGVAYEVTCEEGGTCNTDMLFFKGLTARSLGSAMQQAPHIESKVLPILKRSAKAAVAQCTGGQNVRMCGFSWSSAFDGQVGAGPQMSVLDALSSVLKPRAAAVSSNSPTTGGTTPSSTDGSSTSSTSPTDKSAGARAGVEFSVILSTLLLFSSTLAF